MDQLVNAQEILNNSRVVVAPEAFTLVSLAHEEWLRLLESPELSPRMTSPFLIFFDKFEVTLLLDDTDFGTMRHALRSAKTEKGFRLLTFDVAMGFDVIGFMAAISRILADAGISIVALSAFSRDHLLIKQADLPNALKALGPHVAELC